MKKRKYSQAITFFVEPSMYQAVKELTDQLEIGLSELLREAVQNHLDAVNEEAAKTRDDESLSIVE
jgi:hypothetical protein